MQANVYPIVHDGRTFTPAGEVAGTVPAAGDRLHCGHRAPRRTGSVFPGFVFRHGHTMCKSCANRAEVRDFLRSDAHAAYLAGRAPREVTTWLGAPLCRITERWESGPRYTPTGGWFTVTYVRAVAADGSRWHGRSAGDTCLVRLTRCKVRA